MSHQPLAIYLQDKHSIRDEFEFARYAEQRGFDWWEPITSKVGIKRIKPLQAMREYVT